MKQPLCDWMAAANGFAIYSAHMIPWPRSGMVSLPIKRRLPRKRRAVGHNPRIITALRLLYHVREAAWYNRPSWRERAAPAYRPGHKISIITALRLLYHSSKPIRACLPQSGWQTGKAVCTTHIIPQKITIAIVWRSESTKNLHNLYKRPYSV